MVFQSSPIVKIVKKSLPAVVSIIMSKNLADIQSLFKLSKKQALPFSKNKKIKVGGGSGFFVDEQGTILTNRHVVENPKADYTVVLNDGTTFKPKILAVDHIHDIAIFKIDSLQDISKTNQALAKGSCAKKTKAKLPFLPLGDSSHLELGETVIAIGNALGLFKNTVSVGIVSGLSREIQAQSEFSNTFSRLRGLIQTDAAINPGNSGGPLININGEVIGINAAMVFGAENIGFALPINNAKNALLDLKKYGRIRLPFLGIRYLQINKQLQEQFELPVDFGALVIAEPDMALHKNEAVIPGSPAHKAGLREADIIMEIAGQKITPEVSVNDLLADCQVGQKLVCKILRSGKEKIVNITLDEKFY